MNETYVECLVKRKTPTHLKMLKILLVTLTVAFVLVGFILIPALLFGIAF